MEGDPMQRQQQPRKRVSDLPTEQAIRKLFSRAVIAKAKKDARQGKAKRK
jgi:hypothetical protein